MVRNEFSTSPYFKGSYSYQVAGIHENDYRALEHPVRQTIFFAGEAYNRWDFGYTHTAYTNGLDGAKNMTSCLNDSDKCLPDVPNFIVRDCETKSSSQRMVLMDKLIIVLLMATVFSINNQFQF